jgi:hypothetical protein
LEYIRLRTGANLRQIPEAGIPEPKIKPLLGMKRNFQRAAQAAFPDSDCQSHRDCPGYRNRPSQRQTVG